MDMKSQLFLFVEESNVGIKYFLLFLVTLYNSNFALLAWGFKGGDGSIFYRNFQSWWWIMCRHPFEK